MTEELYDTLHNEILFELRDKNKAILDTPELGKWLFSNMGPISDLTKYPTIYDGFIIDVRDNSIYYEPIFIKVGSVYKLKAGIYGQNKLFIKQMPLDEILVNFLVLKDSNYYLAAMFRSLN